MREKPGLLPTGRLGKEPLRKFAERDVGQAGDQRAAEEERPKNDPTATRGRGRGRRHRLHEALKERNMGEEQVRERDERDKGGDERGETEDFLPGPDLVGGGERIFEAERFLEIGDLRGGRLRTVRLERVQKHFVVNHPKRAGGRVTVETAHFNLVDFCAGGQAGVHHAESFGGAAHVAVFEFVAVSALVVERIARADVRTNGAKNSFRKREHVARNEDRVNLAWRLGFE